MQQMMMGNMGGMMPPGVHPGMLPHRPAPDNE
jgi:hypothetical protein